MSKDLTNEPKEVKSRRAMLSLGAAAAAGAVAAVVVKPEQAEAHAGDSEVLHLGHGNAAGAAGTSLTGSSATVFGIENTKVDAPAVAINGQSTHDAAILGSSVNDNGVKGRSDNGRGVFGIGPAIGVNGVSTDGPGVEGLSENGSGVVGESTNRPGVEGSSENGPGVVGESTNSVGVIGRSQGMTAGVRGTSLLDEGVEGVTAGAAGEAAGVTGVAVASEVDLDSATPTLGPGVGVGGQSGSGFSVIGVSDSSVGVVGISTGSAGVVGSSQDGIGVQATSPSGIALDVVGEARFSTIGDGIVSDKRDEATIIDAAVSPDTHVMVTLISDPGKGNAFSWVDGADGAFTVHLASKAKGDKSFTYFVLQPGI